MTKEKWKEYELKLFNSKNNAYFDNYKEFIEKLNNDEPEFLTEQLEWIENGTYGAGACLALKNCFNGLNNRMNKTARIGNIFLKCLYGAAFKHWNKLTKDTKTKLNNVVDEWLKKNKEFAL